MTADVHRGHFFARFTSGRAPGSGGGAGAAAAAGQGGRVWITTLLVGTKVWAAGDHTRVSMSVCRVPGGTTDRASRPSANSCPDSRPDEQPAATRTDPDSPATSNVMTTLQAGPLRPPAPGPAALPNAEAFTFPLGSIAPVNPGDGPC